MTKNHGIFALKKAWWKDIEQHQKPALQYHPSYAISPLLALHEQIGEVWMSEEEAFVLSNTAEMQGSVSEPHSHE